MRLMRLDVFGFGQRCRLGGGYVEGDFFIAVKKAVDVAAAAVELQVAYSTSLY